MKKIISLFLCLMLLVFTLVSCSDEVIDPVPDHYPEDKGEVQDVQIDMYIIVGEGTTANAIDTVSRQIATKTLADFHAQLNVKYVTLAEYESTVLPLVNSNGLVETDPDLVDEPEEEEVVEGEEGTEDTEGEDTPTDAPEEEEEEVILPNGMIVLVHSSAFMDSLASTGNLVKLNKYILSEEFGSLNVSIPAPLVEASKNSSGELFSIPNNRVLGEYEYLVIDPDVALDICNYNEDVLLGYDSYEDTADLRADITANGYDASECVFVAHGTPSTKAEFEEEGLICNIISTPTITRDDAFASAFAIVNTGNKYVNKKAMEIIYNLNVNTELRNLLQYGVPNTNYSIYEEKNEKDEVVYSNFILETDIDMYRMNYIYTGNAFVLGFCEEIGWTAAYKADGEEQNKQVTFTGN